MDDETYVQADLKQIKSQQFYSSDKRGNVPAKFKHQKLDKFPKKYIIWQAISQCGLKSRVFVGSGTINQKIYVEECLQKRLLPLIKCHKQKPLFWLDLASCDYGKMAMDWYKQNNVNVVVRDMNPPNCPELRPIERYWALMKRKLQKYKKFTKDIASFKYYWTKASTELSRSSVQALMNGILSKVRKFAYS